MVTSRGKSSLGKKQLFARAKRIRLVLTDVDGVLTDGGVYYSVSGEEMKRYSIRDGMGVVRLQERGIQVGIVTREKTPIVTRRAEKLKITLLYEGATDKLMVLREVAGKTGLDSASIAFIGDDVNDLEVLEEVGLSASPRDAVPAVLSKVHYVCSRSGGNGAFREFADFILEAQGHRKEPLL
ncbi:MAG TPA: HAD hydrolase family protein [Bacteroidota bacterium]